MLFAGFNVFQGNLTLPGIIVAGVVGDIAGASIAYAIGYYGSQELLERQGSKLHVSAGGLERAHRWFERWGDPVIFFSRMLPLVRAAFPYAAGVGTDAASGASWCSRRWARSIWISALGVLGREVGSQWQTLAPPPRVRRLRRRGPAGRGDRLPDRAPGAAAAGRRARTSRQNRRRMSSPSEPGDGPGRDLTVREALLLGALHGPAELLPISSSGHVALDPVAAALGVRAASTPSCARRSRWPFTPAPRRRC